jgi:hypothetical protein
MAVYLPGATMLCAPCADELLLAAVVADASGLTQFENEAVSADAELRRLQEAHADITLNMRKLVRVAATHQPMCGLGSDVVDS